MTTAVATLTGQGAYRDREFAGVAAGAVFFKSHKRVTPTLTQYNISTGGSGYVNQTTTPYRDSGGAAFGNSSGPDISEAGYTFDTTLGPASIRLVVHQWAVDAEL